VSALAIDLSEVQFIGRDLARPECVVTTASGEVFVSDRRGGITRLRADGTQDLILGRGVAGFLPNGFSLLPDRSFAIANLGAEGGAWRMMADGVLIPEVLEVDGMRLPATNFVNADHASGELRLWISVSTRHVPRERAFRHDVADGYIVLKDSNGVRIAADGLGFTNENKTDPSGRFLYVNETMARRLSRFAIGDGAALGPRETVAEFGAGTFPDGLAFDEDGHVWVVSIVSNRLIRVAPDGTPTLWLEDADAAHLARVEAAYDAGTMGRPELDGIQSRLLRNISSIAFAGADRHTAVLGCLLGDRLATLRLPIAGVAPTHWNYA
jgi:hypothetical protein